MSKLHELLIQTAETHRQIHGYPFCEITFFAHGETFVNVGGKLAAKGTSEEELIAELSRYLVSRREASQTV